MKEVLKNIVLGIFTLMLIVLFAMADYIRW